MKNKQGFTIIELAVSFILVATVSLTLLQLVLFLKEVYLIGEVKTTLLNKQGIMTKNIYDDLNTKILTNIDVCGLSCLSFNYSDSTSKKLIVDPGNKTISYGDYTMQLNDASSFGNLSVELDTTAPIDMSKDDSIFKINIPIYSKLMDDEDFGFHIIKTYNRTLTQINLDSDIQNTKVTLSGVDTDMAILLDDQQGTETVDGIFVKLYHQESSSITNDIYSFEKFIKENKNGENANRYSTSTSLEAFRMTINKEAIIEKEKVKALDTKNNELRANNKPTVSSLNNDEIKDITETFQKKNLLKV